MAEEMESPTEHSEEEMHHHAEHAKEKWVGWVALTAAFLAALAAITGLHAGDHANEALFEQMQATDRWAEFQAEKSKMRDAATSHKIDASDRKLDRLLGAKGEASATAGAEAITVNKAGKKGGKPETEEEEAERRAKKAEKLMEEATELQNSAKDHMRRHQKLAPGVTMFQIAIAMAAITVLSKKKPIWYVSLALGVIGIYFLMRGTILYHPLPLPHAV